MNQIELKMRNVFIVSFEFISKNKFFFHGKLASRVKKLLVRTVQNSLQRISASQQLTAESVNFQFILSRKSRRRNFFRRKKERVWKRVEDTTDFVQRKRPTTRDRMKWNWQLRRARARDFLNNVSSEVFISHLMEGRRMSHRVWLLPWCILNNSSIVSFLHFLLTFL